MSLLLGFIGDSISIVQNGYASSSTASNTRDMLKKFGAIRAVVMDDQGVSGSKSGDWLSGGTNYNAAVADFAAAISVLPTYSFLVSIMLGTNDANQGVSANTYSSNMANLLGGLGGLGYRAILHYPPYGTEPPLAAGTQTLLQAYQPKIDALCNGSTVFQGDVLAYNWFAANPAELTDGIHPGSEGTISFGIMWSWAIWHTQFQPLGGMFSSLRFKNKLRA